MSSGFSIRRATTNDVVGIARVHIQSWRETYAHLVPKRVLDDLDHDARAARWRQILESGASEVWVALDGDEIIGWASAGAGLDEDAPADRELNGMYVLTSHHGTGAGQALHDNAVGPGDAYLWVATENDRAEAFYRKNGFAPDGTPGTAELAGTPVATRRLVRSGDVG